MYVYACVCVCVCVCVCSVCLCMCVYIYMYTHIYTQTCNIHAYVLRGIKMLWFDSGDVMCAFVAESGCA
jgi:hypothetical protein